MYRLILIKAMSSNSKDHELIIESIANQNYPRVTDGDLKYTKEVKEFIK